MEEKDLFIQLTTKLFNKTEDEIRGIVYDGETLKDDAFDQLSQLDAARVKRFKDESTKRFDDGYKKAQSEIMPNIEKKIRSEFEIIDEGTFDDLIPKIKEKLQSSGKSKMTDDDVKKHPLFIELEKNRIPKDTYEGLAKEFEQYKAGIDRKTKLDRVKEKAMLHLEEFNPDFPDVPTIKQNLINHYLNEFSAYDDFEITADGSIIAIKDGKRVEDAHGNVVPFNQLAKEKAGGYFKFLQQSPKGGAGNGSGSDGNKGVKKYANEQEMQEAYSKATTDEERKEILRSVGLLK